MSYVTWGDELTDIWTLQHIERFGLGASPVLADSAAVLETILFKTITWDDCFGTRLNGWQAADDEPPGHQGQGHHGQDPVQQPLQADPPGRGLVGDGMSGTLRRCLACPPPLM